MAVDPQTAMEKLNRDIEQLRKLETALSGEFDSEARREEELDHEKAARLWAKRVRKASRAVHAF